MELGLKIIARIFFFCVGGFVIGAVLLWEFLNNPGVGMYFLCLLGGVLVGFILSLFTIDSLVEKYYAERDREENIQTQ